MRGRQGTASRRPDPDAVLVHSSGAESGGPTGVRDVASDAPATGIPTGRELPNVRSVGLEVPEWGSFGDPRDASRCGALLEDEPSASEVLVWPTYNTDGTWKTSYGQGGRGALLRQPPSQSAVVDSSARTSLSRHRRSLSRDPPGQRGRMSTSTKSTTTKGPNGTSCSRISCTQPSSSG